MEETLFRRSRDHRISHPHLNQSNAATACRVKDPSQAQALLEMILDRAHLEKTTDGDTLIVPLESWQIDVLSMFGIEIENQCDASSSAKAKAVDRS